MRILRRMLVFVVQLAVVTALVVAGCIAWTLNDRGVSYAETLAFRADLVLYAKAGLVVAILFCLVLLCYHLTRPSLDPPDESDGTW